MNTTSEITAGPSAIVEREVRMQRMLIAYILTGLLFLLLPGTFLEVWNLISISSRRALDSLSPAWIQAHGHAQISGWIGTFILGIGFYSLTKMGRLPTFAIPRGWTCFALWTTGITLRWFEGIVGCMWFHSINHTEDVGLIYNYVEDMLLAESVLNLPDGLAGRLFERYRSAATFEHPASEVASGLLPNCP